MQNTLLFRTVAAALGCMVAGASVGCQQSYWVATADFNRVRDLQPGTDAAQLAVRGTQHAGAREEPVYLRASTAKIAEAPLGPVGTYVELYTPNKRGKKIGGAVLLGLGATLVLGGIVMIGYGASLTKRDSLGAGIIAGFGGAPLGFGIPLGIAGGVLLRRGLGPSDIVPAGEPNMTYVPQP